MRYHTKKKEQPRTTVSDCLDALGVDDNTKISIFTRSERVITGLWYEDHILNYLDSLVEQSNLILDPNTGKPSRILLFLF